MKRKLSILFAGIFLLGVVFGCSLFQVKPDDLQILLVKDGARLAGYELAKKYPQYAPTALAALNVFGEATKSGSKNDIINTMFPAVIKDLTKNINDPLIVMTINDVVDAIKVVQPTTPPADVADTQVTLIKVAVQGFIDGINIAQNAKALNQKMKLSRPPVPEKKCVK